MSSNIWTLQPDSDHNCLERLNEWAQRFKAEIYWEEKQVMTDERALVWETTPWIRGVKMADCTGRGSSKPKAKNDAAQKLSEKGKLTR
ncbi:hypothetical protein RSOLAG22IIIB_05229 [Rhizoctonia solani]|uniref:DRBM domain-containing protein n=1 Tax=Rhizoctonia solani TaxID=456999 RepID=A0A0K6G4U8_9AGAM|nr:hypothetical protein RSOLAG22IIIB_05229 [Rhizoctonia solani]